MSTSPSWFDQEKFSRLVKKVGPKPAPEAVSGQPGAEPDNQSLSNEGPPLGLASTARISLVSKPPSLLSEHRALPALPRRTTPLPGLKTLFQYPPTPSYSGFPGQPPVKAAVAPSTEALSDREEPEEKTNVPTDSDKDEAKVSAPDSEEGDELAGVWQKMALLNEELAHTIRERDQAVSEGAVLREQLNQADEMLEARGNEKGAGAPMEELMRVAKERDEALAEVQALRAQMQAPASANKADGFSKTKELTFLTGERDQARKEYADLRKQFETLKQEQSPKEESGKFRKELEQQLDGFRQKLEERNREIAALKASPGGGGGGDEKLKEEIASLREQLARVKDDASVAQRGLALSQKALHETRDTLREATEGTSLSRHNFDNLKSECAILAQQNTVLQAQNDQLTRELSATKSKLTTRL